METQTIKESIKAELDAYCDLLLERNRQMNLTAITDRESVFLRHFEDSLALLDYEAVWDGVCSVIDIGTGAGLPGIPLAMAMPGIQFTLVDATTKKVAFVNEAIQMLGIRNAIAVQGRAEELGHMGEYRERYDLCVSRAVAGLATLAEYCLPFVTVGGRFVAYKSASAGDEIAASGAALKRLGGGTAAVYDYHLSPELSRVLVCVDKVLPTPPVYPRRPGIPAKRPL